MPTHSGKFISYYRVSTDKQGKSGLGLDAQKAAVADRLNGGWWQIIEEFIEVESGKRASRPQLDAALAACKRHKGYLTPVIRSTARMLQPSVFSGHSLRAGFVTSALQSGADVLRVMDVTRHRQINTLRAYDRRAKAFKQHAGDASL